MRTLLVSISLALVALPSFAQIDDIINKPVSRTYTGPSNKPMGLNHSFAGKFMDFLLRRLHSIDISGQTQEMIKDGVTERKYAAVFSASGALVNWYEIDRSTDGIRDYDQTGSNVGVQIVPYTVRLSPETKSWYLAINPVSLKNMNTLQASDHKWTSNGSNSDGDGFWNIMDNVDFLVMKWDQNMSFDNIKSFTLDVAHANLKLDLLGSSKPSRYLAITAGGTFGVGKSEVTLDSGEVIRISAEDKTNDSTVKFLQGLSARIGYEGGLEYHDRWNNGDELKITAGISGMRSNGYFLDAQKVSADNLTNQANTDFYNEAKTQYDNNAATYSSQKLLYEQQNVQGVTLSDADYKALTGIEKPIAPTKAAVIYTKADQVVRKQIYFAPGIEFSKNINKTGRPIRLGVGVSGNVPLKDDLVGGRINEDLSSHNKNLYNAKLFINF